MKARTFIRIPCRSHADAKEFALRLEADGYRAVRRWKTVIARTETREEGEQLARKLQVGVGQGSTLIWEKGPRHPFAIFASLGGTGTQL
jgi:hypothetical protein